MGLGDIAKGIGDWIVPEPLEDAAGAVGDFIMPEPAEDLAGGLVHGGQTAASLAGGAAKAARYVTNPYNWDDIGSAAATAGSFVYNNPGKSWDVAFEVGRHVVKEEILDPQNLALNLGLAAATVVTGGGAGAAWMAKLGTAGRAGVSAFRAARASGEGMSAVRAVRAGTTAARASDAAFAALRAERVAARGFRATEATTEATSMLGRAGQKLTKAAEWGPNKAAELRLATGGTSPLSPVARGRGRVADVFEGNAPGMLREAVGDVIRASPFRPAVAGLGTRSSSFANAAYRTNRAENIYGHAEAVETASVVGEEAYQFQKNPEAYVTKKAGLAGIDVGAIKAAYNVFSQGKKVNDLLGEEDKGEEEAPKKAAPRVAAQGYTPISAPEAPTSSFRGARSRGGPGTSRSEYVESDFTVGRLDQFQRGIYDPQSIYEKKAARR